MFLRLGVLVLLAAVPLSAPDTGSAAAALTDRATEIISAPVASAAAARGDVTLIDVRSRREWRETGLAEGAQRVTIHNPNGIKAFVAEMTRAVGGDKTRPVALICASGVRSLRAQRILRANGFTQVQNVSEGMLGRPGTGPDGGPGWLNRGLPVTPCPEC